MVAVLLAGVLTAVLLVQSGYTQREFRQRLRDRAQITSYIYLEKDEMRASAFRAFEKKYLQSLNNEILQVYDAGGRVRFVEADERVRLSQTVLARIVSNKEYFFALGQRQAVGIFYRDNQGEYVIVAAAENVSGQRRMRYLASIMGLIFVGSLLIIYLAGRVFAGRALAPIAAMNDQVDRITARDLHLRVDEGQLRASERDDLTRLARTFNRLLARLEASFTGQRTFVSNASHELRTPLTASIGELQVLLTRERSLEAYREGAASVLAELQQLKSLINSLLDMAQADGPRRSQRRCDSTSCCGRCAKPWLPAAAQPGARGAGHLARRPGRAGNTRPPGALLARAFGNLVDNALKYSAPDQAVSISLSCRHGACRVLVRDAGPGIAAADLPHVFQPFFRAAAVRGIGGHGVGLPLARRIVELHGGTLTLRSEPGKGTVADIVFEK